MRNSSNNPVKRTIQLHIVILLFCLVPSALCQQPSPSPTAPLRLIRFNGAMVPFVASIAREFGATIGLEIDPAEPNPNLEIAVDEATIEDVLNAVVKFKPTYSWSKSVNAFALFPKQRRNPLLDTVIASFQVSDVDDADAVNKLLSLPDGFASKVVGSGSSASPSDMRRWLCPAVAEFSPSWARPFVRPLACKSKGQAHTKGRAQNNPVRCGRGKATASHPGAKPVLSSS
jgi:hypothetical protein